MTCELINPLHNAIISTKCREDIVRKCIIYRPKHCRRIELLADELAEAIVRRAVTDTRRMIIAAIRVVIMIVD